MTLAPNTTLRGSIAHNRSADTLAALRHAVCVYRRAIAGDWHGQCPAFHTAVANDAAWCLARVTGEPCDVEPSSHRKFDPKLALCEVYRELAIVCLSRRGARRWSSLRARQAAAELLGIPYAAYVKAASARRCA
ncbi:MAG TPA: hypothetical protein VFR90_03275 [Methylibium sp.]|uniref:hypothetical protein n=1 Tax=Methylibium sp. TaxID=2067992 RepID=UPI002DBAFCAE|nr:hypothetical protein [Methylibium sp.]HEU4458122.1 hypothetical protein [Methylibium sp.]